MGTSLIIIIPEGVETLYSSIAVSHQHGARNAIPAAHYLGARWNHEEHANLAMRSDSEMDELGSAVLEGSEDSSSGSSSSLGSGSGSGSKEDAKEKSSPHVWIGVSLISGFIVMYLVDKLPQFASSSTKQQQRPYHISLDNLGSGIGRGVSPAGLLEPGGGSKSSESFATTTGLVIHAAADGIALGASTSSTSLSFIVFLAILVHKAPASFGLTSVLLRQGLTSRSIRGHLLIFSLAAPVGAIFTWLIAHTLMASHSSNSEATQWRTGILLLFSGGTFL